jgi:hypothetical protein
VWTYECSGETGADPVVIFDLFRDVTTWPRWNPGVEWMPLDGPVIGPEITADFPQVVAALIAEAEAATARP